MEKDEIMRESNGLKIEHHSTLCEVQRLKTAVDVHELLVKLKGQA